MVFLVDETDILPYGMTFWIVFPMPMTHCLEYTYRVQYQAISMYTHIQRERKRERERETEREIERES